MLRKKEQILSLPLEKKGKKQENHCEKSFTLPCKVY